MSVDMFDSFLMCAIRKQEGLVSSVIIENDSLSCENVGVCAFSFAYKWRFDFYLLPLLEVGSGGSPFPPLSQGQEVTTLFLQWSVEEEVWETFTWGPRLH